jgi:hypothetical protein
LIPGAWAATAPSHLDSSAAQSAQIAEHYAELPLSFEANHGQASSSAQFLARGSGYSLYLTRDAAVLELCHPAPGAVGRDAQLSTDRTQRSISCRPMRMHLAGAIDAATPAGENQLPGTVNYFIGNDPAKWRTGITTFAKVRYSSIYSGIDLVYYGNHRELEYDFVVAPGADANLISLQFDGTSHLRRAANGDLLASTPDGTLTLRRPAVYQTIDGRRVPISGAFTLSARHTVRFRLGRYDRTRPLIIDPVFVYSTFLSGSGAVNSALLGTWASAIAVDSQGNAYVTGETLSADFNVTNGAFQTTNQAAGTTDPTAFVSKLNASGTALVCSTYLGGNGGDQCSAIAVDAAGDAFVAGQTGSQNFPVTAGVLQTANQATVGSKITAFVTELNPTGTGLIYSTYMGGSTWDGAAAIAVDAAGNAYVAGQISSTDFPVTPGAFQTVNKSTSPRSSNAFVAKLNSGGTALIYSTFLGGSGGQRLTEGGCVNAATASNDLLGWPIGNNEDGAFAIAVDAAGDAYVAGQALSTDFPVTQGAFQTTSNGASSNATNAFVAKLNPAGSALTYSTFLGGSGTACPSNMAVGNNADTALALAVDSDSNAYIAGVTFSKDFPVTQGAFQTTNRFSFLPAGVTGQTPAGPTGFVAKLNPSGSALEYSTYLGGSGGFINITPFWAEYGGDVAAKIAVDSFGDAYVTGSTASPDFPVTASAVQATNNYVVATGACGTSCPGGAYGYNAFVTKLNPAGNALVYSTYLGGNGANPNVESGLRVIGIGDASGALALDGSGNVYIAGQAESSTFPITSGAFQTTIPAFTSAFISKLALGLPGSGFTITGTPVTVAAGATSGNTSTITVAPTGGFTGSVSLTAAIASEPSGAVNLPTLSFGSTSPVSITGTSPGTATLTITTTAGGTCPIVSDRGQKLPWQIPGGAALAVHLLFAVPRRRRSSAWLALVLLLLCLAAGVSACSSTGKSNCDTPTGRTTAGTYTITITGTSGVTSANGTVTLTVQ